MPQRDLRKLLQDVLSCSGSAQRFAAVGYEQYVSSQQTRYAIERVLQIIGEALSQALKQNVDLVWRITDLRKIIAFRHLLTHRYYRISPLLIWDIIEADLPRLIREVELSLRVLSVSGENA